MGNRKRGYMISSEARKQNKKINNISKEIVTQLVSMIIDKVKFIFISACNVPQGT